MGDVAEQHHEGGVVRKLGDLVVAWRAISVDVLGDYAADVGVGVDEACEGLGDDEEKQGADGAALRYP